MDQSLHDKSGSFETHRRHLTGLAYRMLGSLAEAQDVVQEAYLRWHQADLEAVANARAFLSRTVTRLCLDQLKSARLRHEHYVGPWLPEPVLDEAALAAESASDYAQDLSVALMLTLERLSPLERAAFLLHDVFRHELRRGRGCVGPQPRLHAVNSPPGRALTYARRARGFGPRSRNAHGWQRRSVPPRKAATPRPWPDSSPRT